MGQIIILKPFSDLAVLCVFILTPNIILLSVATIKIPETWPISVVLTLCYIISIFLFSLPIFLNGLSNVNKKTEDLFLIFEKSLSLSTKHDKALVSRIVRGCPNIKFSMGIFAFKFCVIKNSTFLTVFRIIVEQTANGLITVK